MSLRPELPYTGTPTQRNAQKLNDVDRRATRAIAKVGTRITRGRVSVSFTAGAQATTAPVITIPWTTGHVSGIATSGVVAAIPTICTILDNNNGTATIQCFTTTLGTVTGSTTIFYEMWAG